MSDKDKDDPMRRDKDAVPATDAELTPDVAKDVSADADIASAEVTQASADAEPDALNWRRHSVPIRRLRLRLLRLSYRVRCSPNVAKSFVCRSRMCLAV